MQKEKITSEYLIFEKALSDTANEIVGNLVPMDKIFARDFAKLIASFVIYRNVLDTDEIMEIWTKWINSYFIFTKYNIPDGLPIID